MRLPRLVAFLAAVGFGFGLAAGPARADDFAWQGKVAFVAKGLESTDPEARKTAIRKLADFDPAASAPYLLPALDDRDAGVRMEAARVLAKGHVEAAIKPIAEWLKSYDKNEKVNAATLLGDLGSPKAIPVLTRALDDTEPDVRRAAVDALGKIGGPDVIVPLVGKLDDDNMAVRRAAAERLADLGDPRAVIPLVERFGDPSKDVRLAAVRGVGRLGDARAAAPLVRMLRDPAMEVRLEAVEALGLLRVPEAVDALMPLLDSRSDEIGGRAAAALGRIGDARSIRALVKLLGVGTLRAAAVEALAMVGAPAVPYVVACLGGESDACDPTSAVQLLAQIGDARAVPALAAELTRGRVRRDLVVDALAKIGDPSALVPLLSLLDEPDAALRKKALAAVGPILDARAGDVLVKALGDKDQDIRVTAAGYLGELGLKQAVPALLALVGDDTPQPVRFAAIRALGLIGDARATPRLVELVAKSDLDVRLEAADALSYLKDPSSIEPLLALVKDKTSPARRAAVAALRGPLRGARNDSARTLLESLLGGDPALALDALDTLAAMNDRKSLPAVLALADKGARELRRAALAMLGNFGDASALPVLTDALKDEDDGVRGAAAWALGKLGDAKAVPALGKAARDQGFATQVNAAGALARLGVKDEALALALAGHRNPWVRANAAALLRLAGTDAARRRLIELTKDSHRYVRWAAVGALWRLGGAADVLAHIAEKDDAPLVRDAARAAAAKPAAELARDEWVHVYWNDNDGAPLRHELVALVGSDGLSRAAYTDTRGEVGEELFPRGAWDYQCLGQPGEDAFTALDLCEPAGK
jgi:HEAT repeat protein